MASAHPTEGVKHFHLDHLGTPRLTTNSGGGQTSYHVYYPFGEEATSFNQDAEQMKGDTFHGGAHYHVYLRKGAETLARISLKGEILTGEASGTLLKSMLKRGLITMGGVAMFFEASPAGAQEEFPAWFRTPSQEDLQNMAKDLYGTEDLNNLTEDQQLKVEVKFYERLKKDHEAKSRAEHGLDSLESGSCLFNSLCQ